MKRLLSCFLLCFAMFALPVQGAVAAVMMVCSATEAAGLSMPERHAAIKAVAEAEIGQDIHAHCHEGNASMDDAGNPARHDMSAPADMSAPSTDHTSHHAGVCSACAACAASVMLLPEIPLVALQHHRHALPLAIFTSFASHASQPADRPPARHC